MQSPNLKEIERLLNTKTELTLTDAQYKKKTGRSIPKDKSYVVNKSALARLCKKLGFTITVQERAVIMKKVAAK